MLRDTILVQKRELENRFEETYVERKTPGPIELENGQIHLITGPRRAGKSFYAIHLIQQTAAYGYVNFDDERLTVISAIDPLQRYRQTIPHQIGSGNRRPGPVSDVEPCRGIFIQCPRRSDEMPQRPYHRQIYSLLAGSLPGVFNPAIFV